jgi:transcription-repair coupling factor (superfamily II helicase)
MKNIWVNVKDKLKTIAANVDTLTLTATPIPNLAVLIMAARIISNYDSATQ